MLLLLLLLMMMMMVRESREGGRLRRVGLVVRYHRSACRSARDALLALSYATGRRSRHGHKAETVFRRVDVRTGTGSDAVGLVAAVADRIERLDADDEALRQRSGRAERSRLSLIHI